MHAHIANESAILRGGDKKVSFYMKRVVAEKHPEQQAGRKGEGDGDEVAGVNLEPPPETPEVELYKISTTFKFGGGGNRTETNILLLSLYIYNIQICA